VADTAEPVWIDDAIALAVHDQQLAEHGGGVGLREQGGLESALARPINKWNYGEADIAALAAAYAFGIARNHPFVDGNKRTAWVLARLFIALNGRHLRFAAADAIETMLALAAGQLSEVEMADWFPERLAEAG
jgi:death-on-curing protein